MGSIIFLTVAMLLIQSNSVFAQSNERTNLSSNPDNVSSTKKPESEEKQEKPLDFSDTGRPGQQTAGESRGNCTDIDRPIEAIVPASHGGKTVSGHPNFWVYFPQNLPESSRVEFVVQNEAREDIWRSQSRIITSLGYTSFSLPQTEPSLEVGQWYRWYVKIYCGSAVASTQYIQSWVKRVPIDSRLYLGLEDDSSLPHQTYGEHGIWYDAVDRLLKNYLHNPGSLTLEKDWQNLIEAKGVELDTLPSVGTSYEAVN